MIIQDGQGAVPRTRRDGPVSRSEHADGLSSCPRTQHVMCSATDPCHGMSHRPQNEADPYYSTLVGPVGRGTLITRNLSVSLLSFYQQSGIFAGLSTSVSGPTSIFSSPTSTTPVPSRT